MKGMFWTIAGLLVGMVLGWVLCDHLDAGGKRAQSDTVTHVVTQTSVKVDTLYMVRPVPYACYIETTDTIRFDSCAHVREVKEYGDSTYYAKVSGISPALDEIRVYPRTVYRTETVTNTVKERRKRWGVGVHAGYGLTPKGVQPYVGVGVSWDVW